MRLITAILLYVRIGEIDVVVAQAIVVDVAIVVANEICGVELHLIGIGLGWLILVPVV
jgi:hypothetical protein